VRRIAVAALVVSRVVSPALAQSKEEPIPLPGAPERVEVTATKYPEDPRRLPALVTVVEGQDLRDRGATDLRSALSLVAGVDIAPGGDGGPASAVPELWGFREFDAFLLIVDGVPWGGAFNPDLPTVSMQDVDRIEILRGAAPVMYGATSFVGIIQVVRYRPGGDASRAAAAGGTDSSFGAAASFDLPSWAGFASRLTIDAEKRGYSDEREEVQRGHLLWRNQRGFTGGGAFHFDIDATLVNQDPNSPVPRTGATLAQNVPLDANYHPEGSQIDPRRATLITGYSHPTSFGQWSTLASYSHSTKDVLRGFVADPTGPVFPAIGERSATTIDEGYVDARLDFTKIEDFEVVAGLDYMYGRGTMDGGELNYTIASDGSNPPDGDSIPADTDAHIHDTRNFGGIYGYAAWTPHPRWRIDGGLRLNLTDESRSTSIADFPAGTFESGSDDVSETRLGGSAGVTFTAWTQDVDDLRIWAGYRNTYKPAAIDFGLDAEPEILDPETSESVELGLRGGFFDRKLEFELATFDMELHNLVVPTIVGGQPALENAGAERFRGIELEGRGRLPHDIVLRAAWSLHDARFLDYVRDFGGVLTQLEGKRQEMTPRDLAAFGALYAPEKGLVAHAEVNYIGTRWLNKRNTAIVSGFTTWSAGIGWRGDRWEARVDGWNLNDRRDPISESELADAQYYLLEARRIMGSFRWRF